MTIQFCSTARLGEAMTTDAINKQTNSFGHKVIHADIKVTGIDDASQSGEISPSPDKLLEPSTSSPTDDADKQRADHMRIWWDEAIAKNMSLPEGYTDVSVLIIKWDDELDELKTWPEVEELDAVFRDRFRYTTEIVELNMKGKPQLQLKSRIGKFIEEHDGPNNLLIVYYTGHGVYQENEKYLQLAACINPREGKGFHKDAHANWDKIEKILRSDDNDSDVLTILDTCYSSNMTKSAKQATRKFELLSACPIDQVTAAPGPWSFTRALIDNLRDLAKTYGDKPFSTFHLNQRICMDQRRLLTPSHLWHRLPNDQHILLAPLKPYMGQAQRMPELAKAPRGYLTLQFALRDDTLNQVQIEFLTTKLAKAFENKALLGLSRVDWLGIKPTRIAAQFNRTTLAVYAVTQWKKYLTSKREARQSQQRPAELAPMDADTDNDAARSRRKRSLELHGDVTAAKRRCTDNSQPMLSPVSDTWRS
ncbi:uncharacterized protein M421DRAFT_104941 [Didymella exigua CBS 183.55]|uniref:Uncharacterized protein n=1 Tax=Didymella exigua CBS 183.55 TaxID=1150837 RepID=A0A6A5R637_9PLEO|nr:uncharacterized protein M421DRAFT_104941 [Didymella exigua CBS 183.55]KAF1922648.1 hypothetical protein M421DRAFT_104941 [Didymella exigua CBS 183.55]